MSAKPAQSPVPDVASVVVDWIHSRSGIAAEPEPDSPAVGITLEEEMFAAAEELRFEYAAKLRDEIKELRRELNAFAQATG